MTTNLTREYMRQYRIKNKKHLTELSRQYYLKNKTKILKNVYIWQKNNKTKAMFYHKKYKARHKEMIYAHGFLERSVYNGKTQKPGKCSKCGKKDISKNIHGHHKDYSKPLGVVWVCRQCHEKIHHAECPDWLARAMAEQWGKK